ncbi:methyltransferase type 11 [candidate division KSB1 bacterium 4484_87]|nr:MAG: methyltransferase type 11 [candidate division KSB1 bacterium 4484_87]
MPKETKVEIKGFEAKHYDALLDFISLGKYKSFIRRVISDMNIQPDDRILDMGCGTGRNACLMAEFLSEKGSILGLDIGDEMIAQFEKNCAELAHVNVQKMRIDEPLPLENEFDKALLSFVFHGFPPEKQEKIIANARKALKPGGELFILDYQEFDLGKKPWFFRLIFKKAECRLAQDYLKVDWKNYLKARGFDDFDEKTYFRNIVRLLRARLVG